MEYVTLYAVAYVKIGLLEAIFEVTQTNTLANPFGDLYRDLSCFKYNILY